MKKIVKGMTALLFLMVAVAFVPVISKAEVTGLKQTNANRSQVEFGWNAVQGADAYVVAWRNSNEATYSNNNLKGFTGTSAVLSSLNAGTSYYVTVYAYNAEIDDIVDVSQEFEVVTSPDAATMSTYDCTARTETTLTFTWSAVPGATSYVIQDATNNQVLATLPATMTTYTREGLVAGTAYGIMITPVRTSASGYAAYTNYASLTNVYTSKAAPGKPSKDSFAVSSMGASSAVFRFLAADTTRQADGYEVEVVPVKGGKKMTSTALNGSYTNSVSVKKNTPYKYRVRFYVTNDGNKTYGAWSDYRYFYRQAVSGKKKINSRSNYATLNMKWSKVAGATGYTVSISTTRDGKYKKVKTLGKKAKSLKITKIGKKKVLRSSSYYVRVTPKIKDGKKSITNDTPIYISFN